MFELTTSIVIVAPHEVQAIAVPLIRRYSPENLIRFRSHITLMFPFVPFDQLEAATQTLYDLCATIAPFEVQLEGYGEFPGVIYMNPVRPASIQKLFHRLYTAYPDYPPYEGAFGNELHPHMTVAQFEPEQHPVVSLPDYKPFTFRVDRIHLWYGVRDADLPWLTYDVVPLRG
jgi:2'-5' RNA ligase